MVELGRIARVRLREFVSDHLNSLFTALKASQAPPIGEYDEAQLKECLRRGRVQTGTVRYRPMAVQFEFIFQDPSLGPAVLTVTVETPEPIVYMPVPDWVQEEVWQGEVGGTFRFRSEAEQMIEQFAASTFSTDQNAVWFEERQRAKRRE